MCELATQEPKTVRIAVARLGKGCKRNCAHCGAYSVREGGKSDPADLISKQVTEERIRQMLEREIKPRVLGSVAESPDDRPEAGVSPVAIQQDTKLRMIDLFADHVTTDINGDPLEWDVFLHFAKLVKKLSGGEKRVVCISHGLLVKGDGRGGWIVDPDEGRRLKEIVDFMDEKDLFVLSLDFARLGGHISDDVNFASYVETVLALKPAIERGVRVTISIQGVDDEQGEVGGKADKDVKEKRKLSRNRAHTLCNAVLTELRDKYRWGSTVSDITLDVGRQWVSLGRANRRPGVHSTGQCPIIPDAVFVRELDATHTREGFLDMISGEVYLRPRDHDRGYGDVAALNLFLSGDRRKRLQWEEAFVSPDPVTDLTEQFSREARLAMLRERQRPEVAGGAAEEGGGEGEGEGERRGEERSIVEEAG